MHTTRPQDPPSSSPLFAPTEQPSLDHLHPPIAHSPASSSISIDSNASLSMEPGPETIVPMAQLSQYFHTLLPLPPPTPSAAEYARKLLKDRPSFFFVCEIPCSRKYIAVSRSGLLVTFDSASLCCINIAALCGDSGSIPPPLLCAAVTSGYCAAQPPIAIDNIGRPVPLSSPSRRAAPPPRGDVLAAVNCHSIICLYDLATVASGSFGIGAGRGGMGVGGNANNLLQPILKVSLGFEILDCATLASNSFVVATRCSNSDSTGRKDASSSSCGDCSVWLLDCAPLCAAAASSASTFSHLLVHRARVWAAPADRSKVHAALDEESYSSDVRLLPLPALNLLAVCCSNGSVYLLNTHGTLFTIRSTFSRHSQLVQAIAVCEHEGLVISGGVSRDMYLWDPYSPTTCDKLSGLRTGLRAVVVMAPQPASCTGSLAVTLSLDGCVSVWSVRQRTMLTAAAPPFSEGVSIFCHLMLPARNSRIILASNRIFALAPVAATPQTHAPNISLLLSEKSGCCVGLTPEGVLFGLNVPGSSRNFDSAVHHPPDDLSSVGSRCMPVTARDGMHSMHATAACLFSDADRYQGSQMQHSHGSGVVIVYFSPPPISSNASIDLRVGGGADAAKKGNGCLQAHSIGDGQLLRVFEGCSDDISCIAVSSGDKTIGRFLLAGSDQEGGGATLFMWLLPPPGHGDRQVPLLISVQAEKVYPACGAITCIVGRASDVIIAFAGGKIAIFSLVSRSFKFCTSVASVVRAQPQLSVDTVTCMVSIGNFFITGSRDGGVRWWRSHGRLECHAFMHDYRACCPASTPDQDIDALAKLPPITLIDQTHRLHGLFLLSGQGKPLEPSASVAGENSVANLYDSRRDYIQLALAQPAEARTTEQINALQRLTSCFSVFSALEPDLHASLCRHMTFRSAKKGTVVIRQGDVADCMCCFPFRNRAARNCFGSHLTYQKGPASDSLPSKNFSLNAGASFGEAALKENTRRSSTCCAETDVELIMVPKDIYTRLFQQTLSDGIALNSEFLQSGQARAAIVKVAASRNMQYVAAVDAWGYVCVWNHMIISDVIAGKDQDHHKALVARWKVGEEVLDVQFTEQNGVVLLLLLLPPAPPSVVNVPSLFELNFSPGQTDGSYGQLSASWLPHPSGAKDCLCLVDARSSSSRTTRLGLAPEAGGNFEEREQEHTDECAATLLAMHVNSILIGVDNSCVSISCWMTLCERVLQPLWGASMADSFSTFQTAARSGARAKTIVALQPLSPPLFEAALTGLHAKTITKLSHSARIGFANRISNSSATAEASNGAALAMSLLRELQTNPKLLDPLAIPSTVVSAASTTSSSDLSHAVPIPNAVSSRIAPAAPAHVPPLNLSRIAADAHLPTSCTLQTIPATPLTARSEWLSRGGEASPSRKPPGLSPSALLQATTAGRLAIESDAVLEVELLLREKQQRMQEPLSDTVASQYRSLKCPSPDLGYRIVFNGSSNFNMFRPYDSVRVVSARSSRTILNRSVAPLSERHMPTRRPHHGQYITFREDFFDVDQSRAATRSSGRNLSSARSGKSAAASAHSLQAKLDALEGVALKAPSSSCIPRQPQAATRAAAVAGRSLFTVSDAAAMHPSPVPPTKAAAAKATAPVRSRRAGLTTADNSMIVIQNVVAGIAREGKAAP